MLDRRLIFGFSSVISDNSIVIGLVIRTAFEAAHDAEFAFFEVIPVITYWRLAAVRTVQVICHARFNLSGSEVVVST